MTDGSDPTGGWARATEATANATKEAIKAGHDLARFIRGPAGEVVGMLWDHLKVVRFERQIRLRDRVYHFLNERGMDAPTRAITLNVAVPLSRMRLLRKMTRFRTSGLGFLSTLATRTAG